MFINNELPNGYVSFTLIFKISGHTVYFTQLFGGEPSHHISFYLHGCVHIFALLFRIQM